MNREKRKRTERKNDLLLPSGGYKTLKSFLLARLIYDITVRFVELYLDPQSRTCDQMVQAARSGVQNIAEGSIDAATSTKLELNLYNVARGSLEELKLDYQDFLRHRNFRCWTLSDLLAQEFIRRKIATSGQFREFIQWAEAQSPSVPPCSTPYKSVLVANSTLLLINAATYFLKRQIDAKAKSFLENGGFNERMYHIRKNKP